MLVIEVGVKFRTVSVKCANIFDQDCSLSCFENDFSETLASALSFKINKPINILGDLNCNVLDTNDPGKRNRQNVVGKTSQSRIKYYRHP